LPNVSDVTESVVAVTPVPVSEADCVFDGFVVSVTTSVALRAPSAVGWNWIVMLQVAPGFTPLEQVLVAVYSAVDGTAVNARTEAPVLVSVIVFALLVLLRT